MRMVGVFSFAFVLLSLALSDVPVALAQAQAPQQDLCCFIVDRSTSITDNKLTDPIRGAVTECLGTLGSNTQVELVFFSDSASRPKTWSPFDLRAKGEFLQHFFENFSPKGNTRLYDTVVEVLDRIRSEGASYRQIQIIVLSDGEDNRSRQHKSWQDVDSAVGDVLRQHKNGFISWYTLGFQPKDTPAQGSVIHHIAVQNPTAGFKIIAPPPSAAFSASPLKAKVGDPVLFVLQSETGVEDVAWDFGDTSTSAEKQPKHSYAVKGDYDIAVHVQGPGGKTNSVRKAYVRILEDVPLEAKFTYFPKVIRVGEPIQFTDDSLGQPSKWNWSITGQPPRTERSPVVTFANPGKFSISLTIEKEGATHASSGTVDVLPQPPDPEFSVSPDTTEVGEAVTCKALHSEPGWTHRWLAGETLIAEGTQADVQWKTDREGRIDIIHEVTGPGGVRESTFAIAVKPRTEALVARFHWTPAEVHVGDKVELVDESSGAPSAWTWEIEGIGTKHERNPSITFTQAGPANVKLTIEKKDRQATSQLNVEVQPAVVAVAAKFAASPKRGRAPVTVQFEDQSKGHLSKWSWDFGDGGASTLQNPSHTFESVGTYRPRLTVTDSEGRSSQSSGDLEISVRGPLHWAWKCLIGAIVAALAWLVIAVPLAKRAILPHATARLITTGPNRLREKAMANSSIWWPVGYVNIGSSQSDNIKIMVTETAKQNKSLASLHRLPFTKQYAIRAKQADGIQIQVGSGPTATRKTVKTHALKSGDTFFVANTQFRFELG